MSVEIKYRNGFPTKKSLLSVIVSYDERLVDMYFFSNYGLSGLDRCRVYWYDDIDEKVIDGFANYLEDLGVIVGDCGRHGDELVYSIELLNKNRYKQLTKKV